MDTETVIALCNLLAEGGEGESAFKQEKSQVTVQSPLALFK